MAKWFGKIGFVEEKEVRPSYYKEIVTEREYFGDLTRNNRRLQTAGVNDDVNISNEISILADPFANENIYSMKYVEFQGTRWKISKVEVSYPRLILSIGGVYNGSIDESNAQ